MRRSKVKTITALDHRELDAKVNEFIADKQNVHVQRDSFRAGDGVRFSAHITYEDQAGRQLLVEG